MTKVDKLKIVIKNLYDFILKKHDKLKNEVCHFQKTLFIILSFFYYFLNLKSYINLAARIIKTIVIVIFTAIQMSDFFLINFFLVVVFLVVATFFCIKRSI